MSQLHFLVKSIQLIVSEQGLSLNDPFRKTAMCWRIEVRLLELYWRPLGDAYNLEECTFLNYLCKESAVFVHRIFNHICLTLAYIWVSNFRLFFTKKSNTRLIHRNYTVAKIFLSFIMLFYILINSNFTF